MIIELADRVKHNKKKTFNDALAMTVDEIDYDKREALCRLSNNEQQWISLDDLDLFEKHDGGFRKPGE